MMTRLARERNRSPVAWSLLGIVTWIGTEMVVLVASGLVYGVGIIAFGWPEPVPAGVKLVAYIIALLAAIGSVTLLPRLLARRPPEKSFAGPPLPPNFHSESNRVP